MVAEREQGLSAEYTSREFVRSSLSQVDESLAMGLYL